MRRREHVKAEESERIERLARVIATAQHVWDDGAEARTFVTTPHAELGVEYVRLRFRGPNWRRAGLEELLWKLFHGVAA